MLVTHGRAGLSPPKISSIHFQGSYLLGLPSVVRAMPASSPRCSRRRAPETIARSRHRSGPPATRYPPKKAIGVTRIPGGASPVFPVRVGSVLSAISHGEDHGRSPSGDRRRVEAIQQQAQFPPAHRGRLEMRGLRARCRGIGFHAPRIPHPSNDRTMTEAHARGVCQGTAYGVSRPEKMGPFL